jgi:hypothetical protein
MSHIPSLAEIEQIRADLEAMCLPDTGTILALSQSPDGAGGIVETWAATAGGTVACRLDSKMGKKYLAGGAIEPYHTWQLTLAHDADITTDNRFLHSVGTFTVKNVNGGSWLGIKRAELEQI